MKRVRSKSPYGDGAAAEKGEGKEKEKGSVVSEKDVAGKGKGKGKGVAKSGLDLHQGSLRHKGESTNTYFPVSNGSLFSDILGLVLRMMLY